MQSKAMNDIGKKLAGAMVMILLIFSFISCSKLKTDYMREIGDPNATGQLSSIRIINTVEFQQVIGNGDSLTNFGGLPSMDSYNPPFNGAWSTGQVGTRHFPTNGFLGREWRIPNELFKSNGRLDLFFQHLVGFPNGDLNPIGYKIGLTLKNTDKTLDYYLGYHPEFGDYFVAERNETPPSNPKNIKIRVINLATTMGADVPDYYGPVTLTYADGSPVDPRTSQVGTGGKVSEYIEIPYGTYQFRVMGKNEMIMAATDGNSDQMIVEPSTMTIGVSDNYLLPMKNYYTPFAPIHSYPPGGIYTILVYPSYFAYHIVGFYEATKFYQNAFRIIQDNKREPNLTYSKVQGFNGFSEEEIRIEVNSTSIDEIKYGTASAYISTVSGSADIKLTDARGNKLVSYNHSLQADLNYTVYAFPDAQGKPQLTIVSNDLSDKGDLMPYEKRFINLSPDIPFATFTTNDGESMGRQQVSNLQTGKALESSPYVSSNFLQKPFEILAYRSAPGKLPGTWADDIKILKSDDFISNKSLYRHFGGNLPVQEPGYYTIALIGRTGDDVPTAKKAKMVIIKHNK